MSLGALGRAIKKLGSNKTRRGAESDDTTKVDPTPAGTGVLPTLVCEMVIDCVAGHLRHIGKQWWGEDILKTLQACSLTCRAWTPRSQFHLFRFLRVRCSQKQVHKVLSLFDRNPALPSRIEVLVIRAPGLLAKLKSIPAQLCEALPDVPELRISRSFVDLAFKLDSPIIASLTTFTAVTTLSLSQSHFHSPHDIRRVIVAFPRLETLVLDQPAWTIVPTYPPVHTNLEFTTLRIKVLRLTTSTAWLRDPRGCAFFSWLARSGVVSCLEFLVVNTMVLDEASYNFVRELIEVSAKTVKQLSITFGLDFDYTSLRETLVRCTSLRDLGISVPYHLSAFGPLVTFLAGPHRPLDGLLIRFRELPSSPLPTSEEWRSLDEVLQGPQWSTLNLLTVSRVPKRVPRKFVWGEVYADLPFDSRPIGEQLRKDMPLSLARGIMWHLLGLSGDCEPLRA